MRKRQPHIDDGMELDGGRTVTTGTRKGKILLDASNSLEQTVTLQLGAGEARLLALWLLQRIVEAEGEEVGK